MSTPTLEELQTQIEAMKSFIGLDGYRAGQQRIRDTYTSQLQNLVADAKLILEDPGLDEERKEASVVQILANASTLKRRIDQLDKELGAGEEGNRATRRRKK